MKFIKTIIDYINKSINKCPSSVGLKESNYACVLEDCDTCWKMALEKSK